MKLDMTSHDCTQLYTYLNLSRVIKGFPTRGKSVSHAWDTASHREVFVRRLLASLALLLALGSSTAWAQTDFSGTYYIANETNHASGNIGTHWYLVPGADPQQSHRADAYFHNQYCNVNGSGDYKGDNYGDPEKPFLTTYQTGRDFNSVWTIVSTGDGYYNIIHAKTGKYIVYEPPYKEAINRKSIHLETTAAPGENAKFTITGSLSGPININPKSVTTGDMYFNPAVGVGNRAQYYGTGKYFHEGMIGLWNAAGDKSQWYLEKTAIPPTITFDDATGKVTITSVTGTTIRYAFDSNTPTAGGTSYTSPTDPIDVSGHTAIKAIAVDGEGNVSCVITMTFANFTYKILNKAGNVAIQQTVQQPVGKALTGYSDIPAAIRSPYIADETVRFFSDSGHNTEIFETPGSNADIYVTYTTSNLGNKFLHLDDGRLLNVTVNGQYIYDNSGTLSHEATEDNLANTDRMWRIKGEDPYAVVIQNVSTGKCFHYETSALPATLSLTVEGSASHFIIMNGSGTPKSLAEGQMELMPATGENVTSNTYYRVERPSDFDITTTSGTAAQQIQAVSAKASVTYYLIDQAGMKDPGGAIFATIISTESAVELPAEWQSPLVSAYHYYKTKTWNAETLKWDFSEPVTSTLEASEIYVTYDVNNLVSFDDTDDDTNGSTTYMLEFTNGSSFKQEDGDNGVMNTPQQAVYPYANGDGCLNVYGFDQWSAQISSGASTRTRWLWYVVSPNKDPYHVKIMSRSGVVNSHNYFRTYVVNYGGSNHVVTGVTTKHADAVAAEEDPTEYMVLKTAAGKCKLVTKDKIDDGSTDERRTVTSFEQYWKTYETVSNWGEYHYAPPVDNPAFSGITLNYYEARANGRPINTSDPTVQNSKTYEKVNHFFQTINMGSEGEFTFQATTLVPQVILLDQHGWEIMRQPLYSDDACTTVNTAALKHFDSPMVESYHWYPSASVQSGYHKYTVGDPAITIYEEVNGKWVDSERDYTHNSTSLADDPYSYITPTQPKSVKSDMYVTYTVKSEYARLYTGAARAEDTRAAAFLVKQGSDYAVNSSNTLTTTTTAPTDMESVDDEMKWYLRPNFNIDAEMGYKYAGQPGAGPEAKTKQDTEQDYYAAGMNGFDPYNVQVQSASATSYYFRTNAASATLTNGMWVGTSGTSLSLQTIGTGHISAKGYEQTTLDITNATFMVVDDGAGNMRLMPRFDYAKVINSLDDEPRLTATASASTYLTLTLTPQVVHYAHEINVMGGQYILASDFAIDIATPIGTESAPFTGLIDGRLYTIASLTMPLIAYAKDALIKNVIIESASVSSNSSTVTVGEDEKTALGAICNYATGSTRIYNCGINGGSVGASNDYVGGIVGLLDHDPDNKTGARVINCYSYANITNGSYVGGIVGYNNFASNSTDIRTMVMNCMFYGDITGGTYKAPIYNGSIISNVGTNGLGNYNYFLAEKPYVENGQINTYNCALMAETRFLQRFEFYRLLLNSHLELAGWYATGNYDKDEMMKWVLETADRTNDTPKPYPVLKQRLTNDGTKAKFYPSIINIDAENAPTSGERTGKNLGTLAVSISGVGSGAVYGAPAGASITNSSLSLPITDKDYERFNFNYRKVQLPYYNDVGTGNYTKNRVVTGWKITSITGGTTGSFSTGSDATASVDENGNITLTTPYNFADRKCTDKDLFSESERVFNQGAYWDVPEGVTSIEIEPYWAQCVYVSDAYPDVVYNQAMSTAYNVKTVGTVNEAARYTNNKSYSINGDNQVVYTTIGNAAGQMPTTGNVYDNAIVLVGNVHSLDLSYKSKDKSYTIMSIDLDKDNEPDYSYILRYNSRLRAHPVRVDFLNIPGLGMAQKSTGGTGTYNLGIMQPLGWFESTNTSLFRFTQFEYDKKDRVNSPMILQGGVIEQWVTVGGAETTIKEGKTVTYYHVGGNVWFKEFHIGVHQDKTQDEFFSPHPPISVTGGDFDEFYLTGLYNTPNNNADDDAECYINGGRFGKVAGTGIQGIGSATNHTHGNIFWQIDNADIDEFYAGGINAAHIAEGNIYTVITNSRVDQFCGGPKFGNMNSTKKVVTNADNCTFRAFFGAGYGGNSYNRRYPSNQNNVNNINWNNWVNSEYTQTYNADYKGVSTRIDYQFLPMSGNASNVARLCVDYVSFSLATTYDVTSKLKDCTITTNPLGRLSIGEGYKCLGNFYGGGSLGKVNGPVKSTLTNCTVEGNVFGAGYSASLPTIEVDARGFETEPYYYDQSGTYRAGVKYKANEAYKPTTYTWAKKTSDSWIDKTNHILYTTEDLTSLGTVTGLVTLTVDGTTVVGDNAVANSGNVYGGGESSDATGDVNVHILSGTMTDVYGGGKGETTVVSGDVTVNINGGTVNRDVYGGSAFGAVNATKNPSTGALSHTAEKATAVNINSGAVSGSVYGGGLGKLAVVEPATPAIVAQNFGNTAINIVGGTVGTAVFGGANVNGVLNGTSTVTITNGTVGTTHDPVSDVVFGGGYGEPTVVQGAVRVDIGTSDQASGGATLNGHIYGGGALGSVNASTEVNLNKGTINGNVFGGGLGQQEAAAVLYANAAEYNTAKGTSLTDEQFAALTTEQKTKTAAVSAVAAVVGGNATVTLDGATLTYSGASPVTGQIFGGNNLQGSPSGHIKVHVKKTITVEGQEYDVAAVYGGGNEADYNASADDYAQVIIEGCDVSSIKDVYGGGNAAAVPATEVLILGNKKILNVFGGGNGELGADHAAHVGFHRLTESTKSDYENGTGKTEVKLVGGTITNVFGGSNSNGDIRGGAYITMPPASDYITYDCCSTLTTEHIYGGGKDADMSGGTNIVLGCMPNQWIDEIYAGAQNADVAGDVSLTITSGMFKRVFGGNKDGGLLKGSITVNIEETGDCDVPIVIGELYGGGNLAAYSIYGYKNTGTELAPVWEPRNQAEYNTWYSALSEEDKAKPENQPYNNPQLNVRAFTSIGSVFGGGYKAKMIANPHVDINVVKGSHYDNALIHSGAGDTYPAGTVDVELESETLHLPYPAHKKGEIGTIGNVFGGGNLAEVVGNAEVNIGSETTAIFITEPTHLGTKGSDYTERGDGKFEATVEGANITGCVYGGGNEADITGNTQVNICAKYDGAKYQRVAPGTAGVTIAQDVFGAGKGKAEDVTSALVSGTSTIVMSDGAVGQSVYGGGQLSQVGGNTYITVNGGTIGDSTGANAGEIYGNVYGGGKGNTTNVRSGLVMGNTNITIENTVADADYAAAHSVAEGSVITSPSIYHNIYGGGAHGSVGTYTYASEAADAAIASHPDGDNGTATITITGGTIGVNGKENGMVFGSSRGDVGAPESIYDKVAWVHNTSVVIGTIGQGTNHTSPHVKGSVYGGGENGHVYNNASVAIHSGMVGIAEGSPITDNNGTPEDPSDDITYTGAEYPYRGNVYGAGCGTDKYYSDPTGIPNPHDGNGDTYNPKSGIVMNGNATVLIDGGHVVRDVYGAGAMGSVNGSTTVTIVGDAEIGANGSGGGYVFAAARGDHAVPSMATVGSSNLNIQGGTIWMDAYGGGQNGAVKGAVTVNMTNGTVKRDVYGGGALANTNTDNWDAEHSRLNYTAELVDDPVPVAGTTPVDAYYTRTGSGTDLDPYIYTPASGKAVEATNYYSISKATTVNLSGGTIEGNLYGGGLGRLAEAGPPAVEAIAANVYGPVTVNVSGEAMATNVFGCNNINGAPNTKAAVNITGGTIVNSAYGGGNLAAYTGQTSVSMSGGTANYVYGGGLGASAIVTGDTKVAISGGTVAQDVYGGGSQADVTGNVDVTVSGGTITHDVYGGGALANTNTGNWDPTANSGAGGWKVASSSEDDYYLPVKHLTAGTSSVYGFYEDDEGNNQITDPEAKAVSNVTYYKKLTYEENIYDIAVNGTTYKTTVNLTGGTIGNAYGGGLGKLTAGGASTGDGAVQAMVYGDVEVTVDGAAFTQEVEPSAANAPKTGRVFGCNNVNGTPKGSVTVTVNSTRRLDGGEHTLKEFEIQGVYGGGNLADYEPETYDDNPGGDKGDSEFGQKTSVIINGCDATSISKVYGGGNAARVPFTHVTINSAFEIGYVFGGGNGGDMIYKNNVWVANPGAYVTRYTNVVLRGGVIGQAFGGSDSSGSVHGAEIKQETAGSTCPLHLVNLYGAGNGEEASSDGDIITTLSGCGKYSEVQNVFGGSYKANIKGNIILTIKSGIYTSVYGGNDRLGTIGGNITVNIEETDDCDKPIIIQNLYGGCYQTDYPGSGAQHNDGGVLTPFYEGTITVNVRSATRIDRIFGGSDAADVKGDTEVNINMAKGSMSGQTAVLPSYYGLDDATIPANITVTDKNGYVQVYGIQSGESVNGYFTRSGEGTLEDPYVYSACADDAVADGVTTYYKPAVKGTIADEIGTIGNVYGGGNIGNVDGNTTVNIGTAASVNMYSLADEARTVLGAHIYGDVYGGCNAATVTGNTAVNIGTENYSSTDGFEGISIDEDANGNGGSVYGGGNAGDVLGNTNVEMGGGSVLDGVYGGGLHGSVGTADSDEDITYHTGTKEHAGCIGKIEKYKAGTGKCTVVIRGGQVGPVEAAFTDGGMKNTGHYLLDAGVHHNPVDLGFVFGAGRGEVENPDTDPDADFRTYVKETEVIIKNSYAAEYEGGRADSLNHVLSKPIIMASVYGGGENGRVRGNTLVKIYGGQIGCGEGKYTGSGTDVDPYVPKIHTEAEWTGEDPANFSECASWDYGTVVDGKTVYLPYDPMANVPYRNGSAVTNGSTIGSDGHTYYGYVFGGGSGYFPYEIKNPSGTVIGHDWLASAGVVEGSTKVLISGGHILTSVYGGNELTNVTGDSCVVIMSGGTLGVPRSNAEILDKPVTCYLFGGGKGDQREHFKMYTNVKNTRVEVGGTARIFGSVFGGAEDGHVSGSAKVNIWGSARIGTNGTSYVDGNIFGGGRGFSGTELTAGTIKENATINISGTPTILGSVYGGGRMASLGVDFDGVQDATTGQFVEDGGGKTYGHVTINISGGTIGNATPPEDDEFSKSKYSGNVFGGSMGRLTLLDGAPNSLWSRMAQVKTSTVNITGGTIKRNVYGGAEYGTTRDNVYVTIGGSRNEETGVITPSAGTPVVSGSVFGGGLGSDIHSAAYNSHIIAAEKKYLFTPLQYAGCIGGDTYVNVVGKGHVNGSVYGGGDLASVGVIDYAVDNEDNYTQVIKHGSNSGSDETFYDFGLSWPYEFKYVEGITGGKTHVNVKGSAEVDNYVFGAGKGKVSFGAIDDIAEQRYTEAHLANVRETEVTIGTEGGDDNPRVRSVYGGGEDGHVNGNAKITIHRGTIRRSVFGAGKGDTQFTTYLLDSDNPGNAKATTDNVYSWTAGKVYGNTEVVMNGGSVGWFIYGGGNMASVGKGNYAGGSDDYAPDGYGELPSADGPLWTNTDFTESGQTTVTIMGGTLGAADAGLENGVPLGSVFGGSRGQTAKAEVISLPRYKYVPSFFLGYVNKTAINIGGTTAGGPTAGDGPIIYGCIYGGAQDSHVRNSTEVKIFKGDLRGQTGEAAERSGNVFGAGSGIGTYSPDGGANNYCNSASGSVTCTTLVEVRGTESTTKIKGSVYGGGALASVGPPQMGQPANEQKAPSEGHPSHSCNTVEIYGGAIGGSVYGASRGPSDSMFPLPFTGVSTAVDATADKYNPTMFATSLWTVVNVKGGTIAGNVYGGGEMGRVKESTEVHLTGGLIAHDAYGGGKGTLGDYAIAADVGGNTTVKLNEGKSASDNGCIVEKIYGCNDLNGTPKGHVLVHVYATQHRGTTKIVPDGGKYVPFKSMEGGYTITNYTDNTNPDDLKKLATTVGLTASEITGYESAISGGADDNAKRAALETYIEAIADKKYDVLAVYGGGDLAMYEPTAANKNTEVIIDGCALTSIKQVYGGGNAASTPANSVRINEAYEIHEAFGGGNGKDSYEVDGKWYENPGANVGYYATFHHDTSDDGKGSQGTPYPAVENNGSGGYADATTPDARRVNYPYGKGTANLIITGGRVHTTYGGSNTRGNVRAEVVTSTEDAGVCDMLIDKSYPAGKNADTDAGSKIEAKCVDYLSAIYGGAQNANVYSDVVIDITNGTYGKIFGGNDRSGKIYGSITINVHEEGCKPIVIGELYAGGYQADYSIYGFNGDGSARTKVQYEALTPEQKAQVVVQRDPQINIISATKIGSIFGGGYQAKVIGNPSVNVNMEKGHVAAKYVTEQPAAFTVGLHSVTEHEMDCSYNVEELEDGNAILSIGTIGEIYGGGNQADVAGDTHVEIGTGEWANAVGDREMKGSDGKTYIYNTTSEKWEYQSGEDWVPVDSRPAPARNAAFITERVYGGGNLGVVSGNSSIEMANGYVADRIYGGGKEGHVGTVSTWAALPAGHPSHVGCLGQGAPTAFAPNTGKCTITMSGGHVGPFTKTASEATPTPMTMPDDYGYVFGAGRGELVNPETDPDIHFRTYVNTTDVIIKNAYEEGYEGGAADSLNHIVSSPLIAGGVYGGSENGRVLNDTHVNIRGGQIGIGAGRTTAYAEADFIDPTTATATEIDTKAATMSECAAWAYGTPWLPYDEYRDNGHYDAATYGEASTIGTDGHTFYGNVFGGGSGYFTYANADGSREWLSTAGLVEGDTYVNISGGHILTNIYGGNELTDVTGTCHITMTGGTLGVPRTVNQILAHPVTCYLFGAGKGDTRVHFNKFTNVGHADVNVSGGIIYGSVFGGGEDGHVMGNVTMNILPGAKIGTWGTSYVDGNVFGGGRGFSGEAYTAGNVAGSVTMNITGGTMLGSIYGGGRLGSVGYGLFPAVGAGSENYGKMQPDNKDDEGTSVADFPRGHVNIAISGSTTVIGNKYEMIYPVAANIPVGLDADFKNWSAANWTTWKEANHVPNTSYDTSNGRLTHTRGGNVYAGGMGRREQLDGVTEISAINWLKLGAVKSTSLTISGDPWIMSSVYGGGEMGAVVPYTNGSTEGGTTTVTITGGTIGSEITSTTVQKDAIPTTATRSDVKYTFGSVYGGGMGAQEHGLTQEHGGTVGGNTTVSISGANTKVRASVFGGGEMAVVGGDATVTMSNGRIGRNEVKPADDPDAGYVLFGGSTMGNVYGAGKGARGHGYAGQVKGNTTVNISGGSIYHNVYGGGALASVGDFKLSDGAGTPAYIPFADVPYDWKENTGLATVNITGGTIGITGRDNGMVNGSSRGDLERPTGSPAVDHYDKLAWVNNSIVNIGTDGSGTDFSTPLIKGSVYGGGENGHNSENATVNVFSGTIGISDDSDPWYNFTNPTVAKKALITRGNVYGGGCGTDTYTGADGKEYYNPKSGMVGKVTRVNIKGGHVVHNVYGGGSMGSVGTVTDSIKHDDTTTSFALSWPYKIDYVPGTGTTYVTVTGGRIGMSETGVIGEDNGNVYGGTRGMAGSHYYEAHLANVNETYVTINYAGETPTSDNGSTTPLITGSVFGGSEDGHVMGDTHVSMQNGLVKHSLFAGGRGQGTYRGKLKKFSGGDTKVKDIRSITSGKVYGNTYLEMTGGTVWHNVFGGGYMASVGKGNYSGGADDYATTGYGETIATNLWDGVSDNSKAFLNSGKTFMTLVGGTIGVVGPDLWDGLPSGCVYGSSRGISAPNIDDMAKVTPEYCPEFFSGYVNETYVTIGGDYKCIKKCQDLLEKWHTPGEALTLTEIKTLFNVETPNAEYWEAIGGAGPRIYGSVYGGGQDGHVRRESHIIVNKGEIGLPYTDEYKSRLGTSDLDSPLWLLRGNVFGAGSGINPYAFDMDDDDNTTGEGETGYSTSAGSVTHFTQVDVNGGTIHRNVYGGGSLASVGPPPVMEGVPYDIRRKDDTSVTMGYRSMCTVNIAGIIGTPTDYQAHYGGEVYGASRGLKTLDPTMFGSTIWTQVNLLNGADVKGNVFGGGDAGMVQRDARVNVGVPLAP